MMMTTTVSCMSVERERLAPPPPDFLRAAAAPIVVFLMAPSPEKATERGAGSLHPKRTKMRAIV